MASTESPVTPRCGPSSILSIPRSSATRVSATSSVACKRAKVLKRFVYLEDHYLVSLGTARRLFLLHHRSIAPRAWRSTIAVAASPIPINCWGDVLVHPDHKEVIPLAPEPIIKADGEAKNDCERNAARRWLKLFRQEHPHLPVIVVEDASAANAPHLEDLARGQRALAIIGVKPGDHKFLFEHLRALDEAGQMQVFDLGRSGDRRSAPFSILQ